MSAEFTILKETRPAEGRIRHGFEPSPHEINSPGHDHIVAYPCAPAADNAFLRLKRNKRIVFPYRQIPSLSLVLSRLHAIGIGKLLERALTGLFAA